MRALNRQVVEAEANEDGAAVRDDRLTSLETKLLDMGSQLVRLFLTSACTCNYAQRFCIIWLSDVGTDGASYKHYWPPLSYV